MRKHSKKRKSNSASGINPDTKKQESNSMRENDARLDFGGLPSRDLKKNLGCG